KSQLIHRIRRSIHLFDDKVFNQQLKRAFWQTLFFYQKIFFISLTFGIFYSIREYYRQRELIDRYKIESSKWLREPQMTGNINLRLIRLYFFMPYQKISAACVNFVSSIRLPPVGPAIVARFQSKYNADLSNCQKKYLCEYESLSDFFLRQPYLKKTKNVKENLMVSPCEGQVMGCGRVDDIESFLLPNVKGNNCDLPGLLGFNSETLNKLKSAKSLHFLVIYLSPSNIHRFYSPLAFKQQNTMQISGFSSRLLSSILKTPFAETICLNHRLIVNGSTDWGNIFIIPIGALNIGNIQMTKEAKIYSNTYEINKQNISLNEISYDQGDKKHYKIFNYLVKV
ncbi:hypothetical protein MXB_3863, partial [Myxobolus squamalis]